MNSTLWNKVLAYEFDSSLCEYGFTTRLIAENNWTKNFAEKAKLEYKKFMFLAATSSSMVSPSEIVDVVWHQHLIYTKSYDNFCNILEKNIQHIPSTHNKNEFQKFKQAKENTEQQYKKCFGEQPVDIWNYDNMFDSLELTKAKYKLRSVLLIGVLFFAILLFPAYYLLKPLYVNIENPDFIFYLIAFFVVTILLLEWYNYVTLKNIFQKFKPHSFIQHLTAFEVIFLQTQRIANIIHGNMNEMIDKGKIEVTNESLIVLANNFKPSNTEELVIAETLQQTNKLKYGEVLQILIKKPMFNNVASSMSAFQKYFIKSKAFIRLFVFNFLILGLIIVLAFSRAIIGALREKPTNIIVAVVVIFSAMSVLFLWRLSNQFFKTTIPSIYKQKLKTELHPVFNNWDWQYFVLGSMIYAPEFKPIVYYFDKNSGIASGSNCGTSSCGSSCGGGSGCGSSCGGCGGD